MRLFSQVSSRTVAFLVAVLCAVFLLLIQNTSPITASEGFLFDQWTRATAASRPLSPKVALVAIDEGSISDFSAQRGWSWPWPRGSHAAIIAYLKRAQAREIWFDLFFEEPRDAFQDEELRAVAAAAGNVHFAERVGHAPLFRPNFPVDLDQTTEKIVRHDLTGKHLLAWPQPFNQLHNSSPGSSSITPAYSLVTEGEKILTTLPIDDRTDPGKLKTLLEQNDPTLRGAERFRDRIVYIGGTATATYDLKPTAIGNEEPAVMIHVVTRSNEIEHGFFREAGWMVRAVICFACCLLIAGVVTELSTFRRQLLASILILGLVALGAFVLFHDRIWIRPALDFYAIALTFTAATAVNYAREGRKRRLTEELFGKFLSRKMVDRLVARPNNVELGGEKAELTVLFSDLSGFTTLSETMPSDRLVQLLNLYLSEMSELIFEQDGTLDKYIGDAIMAFWGAPDPSPDHALQACYAALACRRRLAELSPSWEAEYGVKLFARIGINTDEMTVGLVGSKRLHNYTVIGDGVNLASRLEGANKAYQTTIMIAQRTVDLAGDKIEVRPIDYLRVKGKTKPIRVYELLARAGELTESERRAQHSFTAAFQSYLRQDWTESERLLRETLQFLPDDPLTETYLRRIALYRQHPPGADWDGVFKLDEK